MLLVQGIYIVDMPLFKWKVTWNYVYSFYETIVYLIILTRLIVNLIMKVL